MSTSSRAVLSAVSVLALVAVATGCSVTVKTQTHYVNKDDATATGAQDWNGEAINISHQSPDAIYNGGMKIIGDASVTKITVKGRMIAWADDTDKTSADLSIQEAIKTVKVELSGNTWNVACGHGGSHNTSSANKSGCELLEIRVPAGSATKPHKITASSSNGDITVSGIYGSASVVSKGPGDLTADITPTAGAIISLQSEKADNVTLTLPSDFKAKTVTLTPAGKGTVTNDFSDVQSGGGRNASDADAAESIKVQSLEFAGADGNVALKKR
ncbi:MAG: hypothetical protein JNL38_35965 [Myxococcales bacterium]|jgi:hypothetical protein|nr:hypothetical protein [Myxococcales bacterium]